VKENNRFTVFKKECDKWVKFYGLNNWRIKYEEMEDESNSGLCSFDLHNRMAVISLNTAADEKNVNPALIAFHEVTELLLARIRYLATERYIQPDEVDDAIHECIRTLENSVWKSVTPKPQ